MKRPHVLLAAIFAAAVSIRAAEPNLPQSPTTQVGTDWFREIEAATFIKPSAIIARDLVQKLRSANPAQREVLISRLLPLGDVAAEPTVDLFSEPPLTTRLASLELLEAWNAPVAGIDPWDPGTINAERLAALKAWAKSPDRLMPATAATTRATSLIASELARLATCDDGHEALLIRNRLARFGTAILPDVLVAIREHDDDAAVERLTCLRYRLVCSDSLAVSWPDGVERLASRESQVRRKAAQELESRVKAQDLPLLRELFSDVDPFVRELALTMIQNIGGDSAREALLSLLGDPDANVRAAVLKQLTENPAPELVRNIVEYARREQDADLVLHAVRVLREMRSAAAVNGLLELMKHPSWQVRAEAAECAKDAVEKLSEGKKADVYANMVLLLEDKDPFVVSRALQCLQKADLLAALAPMIKVADAHPELAGEVIKAISTGSNMRAKAQPYLRRFCQHKDPAVRAAAVMGLCQTATDAIDTEVLAALRDPELQVSLAGVKAFYSLIEDQRPFASDERLTPRSDYNREANGTGPDAWLRKFQSGKDRPEWMNTAAGLCRKMLGDADPERRLFAGMVLVALSHDPAAAEVIMKAVETDSHMATRAAHVLLWLPTDQRSVALERLLASVQQPSDKAAVIQILGQRSDEAATKRIWMLLESQDATPELAEAAYDGLRNVYIGERYYDANLIASLDRPAILAQLRPKTEKGPELRRTVALSLILIVDPSAAAGIGKRIREEPDAGEWLRLDALQIRLLALPDEQSRTEAIAAINGPEIAVRKVALPYLAGMDYRLNVLRGTINISATHTSMVSFGPGDTSSLPQYPAALDRKVLAEIVAGADEEQRVLAAYLLALDKDRKAMDMCITYWRSHQTRQWRKLAYRVIAVANDDTLTAVLEEIYRSMDKTDYEMRDFYWTIRSIKGTNILKLRKQIRDEVGMDRLR